MEELIRKNNRKKPEKAEEYIRRENQHFATYRKVETLRKKLGIGKRTVRKAGEGRESPFFSVMVDEWKKGEKELVCVVATAHLQGDPLNAPRRKLLRKKNGRSINL